MIIKYTVIVGVGVVTILGLIQLPVNSHSIQSYRDLRYEGVVGQTTYYTCGPAAVATLLNYYYALQTSELEILELSHEAMKANGQEPNEGEGINTLALAQALKMRDIPARGMRIPSEKLSETLVNYFDRGGVPVILHVTKPQLHYVVAVGVIGHWVILADPSWGRKVLSLDNLIEEKGFEGTILIPSTPNSLLPRVRERQTDTINWAEKRLKRLNTLRRRL